MRAITSGEEAERLAERFLSKKGMRLVTRNFRARTGEIDLIMSKQDTLVFVEVRLRKNPYFGSGADSVTRAKRRKLINTAHTFLQLNGSAWNHFRFDVVSIGTRGLDWIPGAFTLD